jgi:hypothetical protein
MHDFFDDKVEEIKGLFGKFPGIQFLNSQLDGKSIHISFTIEDFSSPVQLDSLKSILFCLNHRTIYSSDHTWYYVCYNKTVDYVIVIKDMEEYIRMLKEELSDVEFINSLSQLDREPSEWWIVDTGDVVGTAYTKENLAREAVEGFSGRKMIHVKRV